MFHSEDGFVENASIVRQLNNSKTPIVVDRESLNILNYFETLIVPSGLAEIPGTTR